MFSTQKTLLAFLAVNLLLSAAWAQKESVRYRFCKTSSCKDGAHPQASLIFDKEGNLYGTASGGGNSDSGTVFKVTPSGKQSVLYTFCGVSNCADGQAPQASLVIDTKGNLYGTTFEGGRYGGGTVFKVTPSGKESVLHGFCAQGGCSDGEAPTAGLVFDKKGNLYGTTSGAGANGGGTVFKVTPSGKESVLYSFCAQSNCTDGELPSSILIFDEDENLYGTTYVGGAYAEGTVFKVTPSGEETVLYSFCKETNCTDGSYPYAGLVFDKDGNLYGTTVTGGAEVGSCSGFGCGTVFKVTHSGVESVLYSFDGGGDDGAFPHGSLVFDKKGSLYGTTSIGGAYGQGTVFKFTSSGEESVLYGFCAQGGDNCSDGAAPLAGLIFDGKGNLYGTTSYGGNKSDGGVIFKLVP
jgi:uncharacterized repeat protein (TIGR03803 family)